ncbi:MAG: hypothetical protein F6J87_29040 [Spirulina sp. SIO3F2]|nr:hypothetical protein [Spirulina sp. SIO3F2]
MDNRFTPLEGDEVLSVDESVQILIGHRTFRASELTQALKQHLVAQGVQGITAQNDWFALDGVSCEALRFGANRWLKGRVRISLEFCPDEGVADIKPFSGSATESIAAAASQLATENAVSEIDGSDFVDDGLGDVLTEADLAIAEPAPEPTPSEPPAAVDEVDEDSFFDTDDDELSREVEDESAVLSGELDAGDDLGDDLLATPDDDEIDDIFEDAPVDLSQDDELGELSDPIAAMVDGLVDDNDDEPEAATDDTDDIFADAPVDLSDEAVADDLFGDTPDMPSADDVDPFAETSGGDEVDPFAETPNTDDLSGLLDDADDVFADAPTEMPAAEDDDLGADLFAEETPEDTTTVAEEDDIFALDDDEDIFGDSDEGELDLGGGDAAATNELAVEDAEDLFGDDDDDAIDWGLDDGDELSLDSGDGEASEDGDDDSVFADIWNDIDEMA